MDMSIFEELREKVNLANVPTSAFFVIAVVLVLITLICGRMIIDSATASQERIEVSASPESEPASQDADARTVYVHVAGAVATPGLYELPAGSRLAAAIEAAGGFAEDALGESCNLARVVEDGEQIIVPKKGASEANAEQAGNAEAANEPRAQPQQGKLNLNTASTEELQSLPGIGPSIAQRIVSDRQANGSFKTLDDLKRVSGIGDAKFDAVKDLVCV